jgi:FkbM family methyltransferase
MIKALLKTAFHSLGYSIARLPPPPGPPVQPVRSPPLRPLLVELFPGFPVGLDLADGVQRRALLDGPAYEAPGPALLRSFCTADETVFFDIGANFGYYSYYMLQHSAHTAVHSFEPNPAHVARQQAVARAHPRYQPHQIGLGDRNSELSLTVSALDSGWSTFGENPDFKGLESTLVTHRVPVTTFDAWCAQHGLALPKSPMWVAKIDVEGYEPRVLRGMVQALKAQAFKVVLIEILDHTLNFCGSSAADVFRLFDESGYAPFDERLQPTSLQPREARNVIFLPRV